ncbi:MAG: restriction endonuclease [Nitrospirota bacterium]|nr:restriction endonuclease [Nitrospirota bacterium]
MTEDAEKKPEWKLLEHLVAEIQRQLAPDASVQHNVSLYGVDSETQRQIDVLVEQRVGQYAMRIIVDCKDYAKPVDVKGVEEFYGLVRDVRAQKGALVCPKGFTPAAKKLAEKLQVEIYSPVDTDPHKWTTRVALPVVCDVRSTYMSFGVSMSAPLPFMMPPHFFELPVFDEKNEEIGNIIPTAQENWDLGRYPVEPGEHLDLDIFIGKTTRMDNGYGQLVEVSLTVGLLIKRQLYFGYLPVEKIRGLRDEQTGLVVTNAFTTQSLDFAAVQKDWTPIEEGKDLPMTPVLSVVGLDCYGYSA